MPYTPDRDPSAPDYEPYDDQSVYLNNEPADDDGGFWEGEYEPGPTDHEEV